MAKKITVDRLSDEIMDALEEYKEMTDEVERYMLLQMQLRQLSVK